MMNEDYDMIKGLPDFEGDLIASLCIGMLIGIVIYFLIKN